MEEAFKWKGESEKVSSLLCILLAPMIVSVGSLDWISFDPWAQTMMWHHRKLGLQINT